MKIWSDIEKKANWAINKIKKSASFSIETIIATQIFAAGKISKLYRLIQWSVITPFGKDARNGLE